MKTYFKMKFNDRLKRVQYGREKDVPLSNSSVWFLVIKNDGDWDAENNIMCFKEDIEKGFIKSVFSVWHGQWRTNLFYMSREFLLDYFKNLSNNDSKQEEA